jgi:hypothetical protein
MSGKVRLLNFLLAICVIGAVWEARVRWLEADAARRRNLEIRPRTAPAAPPPATPVPQAPAPAQYEDVAKKNLFSKDRNPDIVIEPVKVEPPKPMPPLPLVYGVMGLPSGVKAIMSEKPGEPSHSVRAGDTVGEFQIVTLDIRKVAFLWDGKRIEKTIDEMVDRSKAATAAAAPVQNGAPPPPPPPTVNQIGPPQNQQQLGSNTNPSIGVELTPTMHACRPGENSPAGTVLDGYRKEITQSPFGSVCRWVKI